MGATPTSAILPPLPVKIVIENGRRLTAFVHRRCAHCGRRRTDSDRTCPGCGSTQTEAR